MISARPKRRTRPFSPVGRALGILSGTSCDGIDAAIVRFGEGGPVIEAGATFGFPSRLRDRIIACDLGEEAIATLDMELGKAFGRAASRLIRRRRPGRGAGRIDVIGSHGQTIYHAPRRASLQIGSGAAIAAITGLPVVTDFRSADIAEGGEGAPLAGSLDLLLLGGLDGTNGSLNIGGMANLTIVSGGSVTASFDTGPGNALIDEAVRRFGMGRCDRGGRAAASGRIEKRLLSDLMEHPFIRARPPKSTGRDIFGPALVEPLVRRFSSRPNDLIATLTAFTARSIAGAVRRFSPDRLFVSGGGIHNRTMMRMIQEALGELSMKTSLESSAALGVDPDLKEAVLFALLGKMRLEGSPGNIPAATGARRPAILGALYLPPP